MKTFPITDGWLERGLIGTALTALSSLFLCAGVLVGCSRAETPERKAGPPKPEPKPATETIVHERKLPSGNTCRAELRGRISPEGIAAVLQGLSVSITNREVHVPAEAFSDLTNVNAEFAEFAGDTFLLLCGGADAMAWRAKFTVHNGCVTVRELTRAGGTTLITTYQSDGQSGVVPLKVHDGRVTGKEFTVPDHDPVNVRHAAQPINITKSFPLKLPPNPGILSTGKIIHIEKQP
ncbi:MAG: hypothetical protein NTW03_04305 [Verrucomicrobia bacterium]|nr:hypothetical protein [Verrucomicrobiota bacterium]